MDPTRRFSNRVADYVRYRPGYPLAVLDDLAKAGVLTPTSVIADVGSGTGLLTGLFLRRSHRVYGIEPNPEMRAAGEQELRDYSLFTSFDGAAEATGLPAASVDVVTAGQAFHWFDRSHAQEEFRRILRSPGWAVLVWNERLTDRTAFLREYEQLLQTYATDYQAVDHRRITDEMIADFFAPAAFTFRTYENRQVFDLAGLRGRLLSSSYSPPPDHPQHAPMLTALEAIFQRYQEHGNVVFEYETQVYAGRLV